MEKIAKDRYEGRLKKGQLSEDYIRRSYAELNDAASQGYGSGWLKVNGETGAPSQQTLKLQQNLWKFSGAKSYAVLEEINHLLTKDGKPAGWEQFKNDVMKLNPRYNQNYLQAEWQTAKQAAKMAANWEAYQRNKELYPNLEFRTQNDSRVRDAHRILHGIVKPLDDDFWKSYFPPLGWRCRCYTVQTAAKPTETPVPELSPKDFPLEFRNNVGISGEIFKETDENKGKPHPYFALSKNADNETKKAFEYSKLAAPLTVRYTAKNGAEVRVSPFTDTRPDELIANYRIAVLLAEREGLNMDLVAKLDGHVIKEPNPEYLINKTIKADRKAPLSKDYTKTLSKANKQGCEVVIYDLSKNNDDVENAMKILTRLLSRKAKGEIMHPNIKEVYIISADRKVIEHFIREKAD